MTTPNVYVDRLTLSGAMAALALQIAQQTKAMDEIDPQSKDGLAKINIAGAELDDLCDTLARLAEAHAAVAMKAFDDSERIAREERRS